MKVARMGMLLHHITESTRAIGRIRHGAACSHESALIAGRPGTAGVGDCAATGRLCARTPCKSDHCDEYRTCSDEVPAHHAEDRTFESRTFNVLMLIQDGRQNAVRANGEIG